MTTRTKREVELDEILNDPCKFDEYIKNANHVRRKISGRVCYFVPYGNVEENDKFSLLEHSHEFTDTFLIPEEFAKSSSFSECYLENMYGDTGADYISIEVSPEGGHN